MSSKLPALQFYVGDWQKDPGIQALDFHQRGVWFEILLLMHESEERGRLLLNGRPMPMPALARILGIPEAELKQTVSTIEAYGVASRDEKTGVLYNRRMVRDEAERQAKVDAGRKGGRKSKPPKAKRSDSRNESTPEAEPKQKGGSSVSTATATAIATSPATATATAVSPDDLPSRSKQVTGGQEDRSTTSKLRGKQRSEAAALIEDIWHLGEPTIEVDGKPIGMRLEMHILDELAQGYDVDEILGALPLIRVTQDFPDDEPISLRVWEQRPQVLNDCIAEFHKRQPVAEIVQEATRNMRSMK